MKKRTGQSTVEFAMLIFIIITALLSMMVYVKRGVQGHYRDATSSLGGQYDPRQTTSSITQTHQGTSVTTYDSVETNDVRTDVTTTDVQSDISQSSGHEHIAPMSAGL